MTEQIVAPAPGVCFSQSYYSQGKNIAYVSEGVAFRQSQNRWDNGANIEFYAGYVQKVAGWAQATSTVLTGIPRALTVWRDNNGGARIGVGTETHLYTVLAGTVTDITPLRTLVNGTASLAFSSTLNTNLVTVADAAAKVAANDWVFLNPASPIGGITLNGWYQVLSVIAGVSYVVTAPVSAASSAGPTSLSTIYQYPRTSLSSPFATTLASPTVTVTHTAHGAVVDSFVLFSGASAVAGLTLSGEYQIATVIDPNTYTITAASNASGTTTGGGTVSVVYPIQIQQRTPSANVAFSNDTYGVGAYSASGAASTPTLSNGWTLAAYGNQLLASPIGGTIYVYNPVLGGRAYPLLNAPTGINAMFVTPERFVIALGLLNNPMQMAWCDQNDYTQWSATPTNTANSGRTLVGGSFLVGGIAIRPSQALVYSDRCVFSMTYQGGQNIYSTLLAGDNCGLVDPTAVCCEGGQAYWMSDQEFFAWNGAVTPIPSDDIRAEVFGPGNLNREHMTKCTATLNRAKKQVRFYYPSGSSLENNVGMIFQYDQSCWSPLAFGRSAATDANLLSSPVSADTSGLLYWDETGSDANGEPLPWSLQLGTIDVSNGDRNMDIWGFTPDFMDLVGNPQLNIITQFYPSDAPHVDGPYSIVPGTQRIDLRSDGKLFAFALSDNSLGSNFRLGLPRVDISPSGARR